MLGFRDSRNILSFRELYNETIGGVVTKSHHCESMKGYPNPTEFQSEVEVI